MPITPGAGTGAGQLQVIVVGASLAGLRTAEALRKAGYVGGLTIVGEEVHPPYDRPPLSKTVLTGDTEPEKHILPGAADIDANWVLGRRAVRLDLIHRKLVLDGGELPFDGLVIATGARPRLLSTGSEGPASTAAGDLADGVHVLRSLEDSLKLRLAMTEVGRHGGRIAILGGGFIGTEAAAVARGYGLEVSLIDPAPLPLWHAVGVHVASHVADLHRENGIELHLGSRAQRLETGDAHATRVHLETGVSIEADLVLLGLGTTPNTEWLSDSGAMINRGVRTDAHLRVLDSRGQPIWGVVAAGDVVNFPHPLFGNVHVRIEHWSNAVHQARTAAATLHSDIGNGVRGANSSRHDTETFNAVPTFWSDQYNSKINAIGLPQLAHHSTILHQDPQAGRLVVGYERAGRLVGAVAVNHPRPLAHYRRYLAKNGTWPPPPVEADSHTWTGVASSRGLRTKTAAAEPDEYPANVRTTRQKGNII